jgi:hypothetical protein
MRSPYCSCIALPCFISLGDSSSVIFIRFDVFFEFVEELVNAFGLLSGQVQGFDQRLYRCHVICFRDLRPLLHESSYEVPQ